ncbi:MAG TPA: four helix bundle protein [Vicinamibacterales bacterium]|nr:four helix bundle protein [Vicinamibacterales bacterium]
MSRAAATSFTDLLVWQKAHALVLSTYSLSADFPRHELFGLTSQIRRAAVSVPANIAESFRRRGRDKARFLNIAAASLGELQYHLILAGDPGYAPKGSLSAEAEEVSKMLSAYERTILWSMRAQSLRTILLTSVFCVLHSAF